MDDLLPSAVWPALRCPNCGGKVHVHDEGASCSPCAIDYGRSESGILDLRPRTQKTVHGKAVIGKPLVDDAAFTFEVLRPKKDPEVDFSGVDVPISRNLLSYFPKAKSSDSLALDIGCGDVVHRGICEHAGFNYVGLDYQTAKAPMLGDAHALPFADQSFDFILSFAVLEHIQYPHVMMSEAFRVLKPRRCIILPAGESANLSGYAPPNRFRRSVMQFRSV